MNLAFCLPRCTAKSTSCLGGFLQGYKHDGRSGRKITHHVLNQLPLHTQIIACDQRLIRDMGILTVDLVEFPACLLSKKRQPLPGHGRVSVWTHIALLPVNKYSFYTPTSRVEHRHLHRHPDRMPCQCINL